MKFLQTKELWLKANMRETKNVGKLSHGFGVKRDSRGMFSQLGDLLKDEYLVVRFDFNDIKSEGKATYVFPLSVQAKMLDVVCGE